MGRKDRCCVCKSTRKKDKGLSFYRLPEKPERRKLWLCAIRQAICDSTNPSQPWKPSTYTRLCARHFAFGRKCDIPGQPGYIPTIFDNSQAQSRLSPSRLSPSRPPGRPTIHPPPGELRRKLLMGDEKAVWSTTDHDYIKTREEKGVDVEEVRMLGIEIDKMKEEIVKLKKANLCIENIKDNPEDVRFWTGFPNYGTFVAVFNYLKAKAATMRHWRGETTFDNEHFSSRCSSKPGKERTLSLEEEFFAVMVRLRVGLLLKDISARFLITEATFSRIFSSWINLMYIEFKALFELPCKTADEAGKARCFREFPDVVITVDCTELFTEKPSDLDVRKQLYSNYKHHETLKVLIGISPSLAVNYCSACYGGRASDKFITGASEDLLGFLKPGDSVMADKGFTIDSELGELNVKLIVPDFKGAGRSQLTGPEIARSNKISKARVHVERIIGRIKRYHILDGNLKLSMKNTLEQIVVVCAYLVNFQAPVVKSDDDKKKKQ